MILAPIGGKLGDVTDSQTQTFLPKSAESTEVLRQLTDRFPSGDTSNGLIVYKRPGGLTAADKQKIADDAEQATAKLPLKGPAVVPFQSGGKTALVSASGDVAVTSIAVPDDQDKISDWGKDFKEIAAANTPEGLQVYATGDLGFTADADEVFNSIDTNLLLATVLLVLVLLGAIYRSPLIALIPLVVVGFAYACAQGLIYLYAKTGATVSENSTQILIVLMFGVGTDYCLLLVSRYREELRRREDKHEAMAVAVGRAGPAILASGLTVTLAMLVLLVADAGSTRTLGPVSAIGIFTCMTAGLTLLPALLTIGGRRGFWPRRRLIAYAPDSDEIAGRGLWRRLGDRVLKRPGLAFGVTFAVFAVAALGLLAYNVDYSTTTFFKKQTESVDGFRVIESSFPAGLLQPTDVLVERTDGGPATRADAVAARRALRGVDGVARVFPVARSTDGKVIELSVILSGDPYDSAGLDVVPAMRSALSGLPSGLEGAGRRRERDQLRLRSGEPARPEARRAAGAADDRDHPRDPADLGGRAAGLYRQRRDLVPRHGRDLDAVHSLRGRRRRDRQLDPDLRVHLPGRARDRLHDLPDEPGPRGGPRVRDQGGDAAGAERHRAGDHGRRDHPRRHLLRAHDPAGHVHLRPRFHGRARDPARHLRRPHDHAAGGDRADRRPGVVALDGAGRIADLPRHRHRGVAGRAGARDRQLTAA